MNRIQPRTFGIFIFLLLAVMELTAILFINHNRFFYTLDDPYIHLSLAEHIAHGHYGINTGESSAPSSSIVWPFLLAPFARTAFFSLIPLLLNLLSAFATVILLADFSTVLAGTDAGPRTNMRLLFTVLLIIATNVCGLVFTGMEHSLQLLCTLFILRRLVEEVTTGRVHRSVWFVIAAAPLVRYECAGISLAASAYLFARGYLVAATATVITIALLLTGFSWFLMSMGLAPFPSSIMAKSAVVSMGAHSSVVNGIGSTLAGALTTSRGLILVLVAAGLAVSLFVKKTARPERLFAAGMLCAVLLHLLAGRYGSYNRYEVYIWSAGILTFLFLFREKLRHVLIDAQPRGRAVRAVAVAAVLLGSAYPYVIGLATIPAASENVYKQQYQMRRFAVSLYKKPVGVNDIGLVSYRNPLYVLDYAGLASEVSLRHVQAGGGDGMWMDTLAREHDVRFAMVYREWFDPVPAGWIDMGTLTFDGPRITPAGRDVTFFAMDSTTFLAAAPLVASFAATLPKGARFERREGGSTARHSGAIPDVFCKTD